jgi:DNA-binding transcriptional LysR family regulator
VPSALTYSVRQLEEALDVLLFDRKSGQAKLTAAGQELLNEGRRLLAEMAGVANRVRRVATGWEAELTIAVDGVLSSPTMLELVDAFYQQQPQGVPKVSEAAQPDTGATSLNAPPPTRLRLRTEVLAGTWEALLSGQADLAVGVSLNGMSTPAGFAVEPIGELPFALAMSPHHPLAQATEPIGDDALVQYRAVAVSDSASRLSPLTVNLLPGQDVLTVSSQHDKLQALLLGLGLGFMPAPWIQESVAKGHLVTKAVRRISAPALFGYTWRTGAGAGVAGLGLALQWWLAQLSSSTTRQALLTRL